MFYVCHLSSLLLLLRIIILVFAPRGHRRPRARARANISVPRSGATAADAASHAPSLAPVPRKARGVVAVLREPAQPARPRRVVAAAEHAAAKLPHFHDSSRVTPLGSPSHPSAGEAHVEVVAEEALAKHLAELVHGLRDDALLGSFANVPGGVEEVFPRSKVAFEDVVEHAGEVLRRRRAARQWSFEVAFRLGRRVVCMVPTCFCVWGFKKD
jgi:hypothetical protein